LPRFECATNPLHGKTLLLIRPWSDARFAGDCASRCPPTTGPRDTPDRNGDCPDAAEIVVIDPVHPLYGRRFRLVTVEPAPCPGGMARVDYRFGLTLRLPLTATNLWSWSEPPLPKAKLSTDAIQDLIVVAGESEGACPSNLKTSGPPSRRRSAGRLPKTSQPFCGS
jgi:hypothetical protein